jgi:hypothetical protein
MNDKSSGVPDAGTSEEPDTSGGAAPTYGPAGNTTDAEEEGAG